MTSIIQQNNVRYNIRIIDEVIDILRKTKSFNSTISKAIRERILAKGEIDKTKIDMLSDATGIEKSYFTGEKRFVIPDCEMQIRANINVLNDIDNSIENFMYQVSEMVKIFGRGEFIQDENLERIIYFINNNGSMVGYIREKEGSEKAKLKKLCMMMESIDNRQLLEADINILEKLIKLAEEKIAICKAGIILNKKK